MHKAILMMILAVVSSSAMAEWVEVTWMEHDDGGKTVYYADPTTLRVNENRVKIWALDDHVHYEGSSSYSVKSIEEFDCEKDTHRTYNFTRYSGNMGHGKIITSDKKSEEKSEEDFIKITRQWGKIIPGTIMDELMNYACNEASLGFLPLKKN